MSRRVIFVPDDYWTDPPQKGNPPMTAYIANPDAALAILGALDALARHDDEGVAMVLYPWRDDVDQLLGVAFNLLHTYVEAFATEAGIDPADVRDHMRRQVLDGMASQ